MTLDDAKKNGVPLWQIEDTLIGAKKAAQSRNVEECHELTEKALRMLEE